MDQGWKQLPLFVIILLLSDAYGFKGGASSNANHQSSDYAFSPHAVQSSVSEVPVTGILPEELEPLKELNLLQFVNGGVSSSHESTDESGSPSSYPSVALSSPQGAFSESAAVQSSQNQLTSSYDTQPGSSTPFTLQGSTSYGGSLQLRGTTSQFASGSPSSYPSVALSSPQWAVSQSATVQRPWKQFTSTSTSSSGTQSGSSTPFNLQGSNTYGGSFQLQGTSSQFASGSPASYPSVALSSPQGVASQQTTNHFSSRYSAKGL